MADPTEQAGLTTEELAAQDVAELPRRDALTVVDPGTVLGGASLPNPTGGAGAPAPAAPPISLPHVPVPAGNPGGTYQPDASASSHT